MTPQTQAEANVLGHLIYMRAPGPFYTAKESPDLVDRCYLHCGSGMRQWCDEEKTLISVGRVGRAICRALHKRPYLGFRLLVVYREDVPGADRFSLQINGWYSEKINVWIWECDHDGFGALHAPTVFGHVGMGIWHMFSRQKTDQRACMLALRSRGIKVAFVGTGVTA